jgi:UDP-N-acetylmuramoyl-L-alanyl-D-glutamate--2,6-diaminopimelate ligase
LRDAAGAPGRLQRVDNRGKPRVSILVDYAHTDDALENVLKALRPLTRGKLRVVFGCGGDRDATKRPRMAAIARRLGDAVYVTSDNPRTEDPDKIIGDILSGWPADERAGVVVEPDRRQAIFRAIEDAAEQDVVLIAGKGHEKYQIIGAAKQHFDDVEEASRC